ncbi:hypothetical protein CDL15_Pgr025479 [Punica granatum]|uniref:Uncharacterized protein n=1 Tax=Punica granatum TaxID=22663 RepID=A0A218WB24_PUNGR|nr:hypothetical protein CDL15_Pgr025479 [Punica granatum]
MAPSGLSLCCASALLSGKTLLGFRWGYHIKAGSFVKLLKLPGNLGRPIFEPLPLCLVARPNSLELIGTSPPAPALLLPHGRAHRPSHWAE